MSTRFVVIGLGGTGSWLVRALAHYLWGSAIPEPVLVLVDGDDYEEKNLARQDFHQIGPKAMIQAAWVVSQFGGKVGVDPVCHYVGAGDKAVPVAEVVKEGDVVFVCVDNHRTRKVVLEHAATLKHVDVFLGGNEETDGSVQVFMRAGIDCSPNPLSYHPEMENPVDKSPHEMSCEEKAAAGTPQVIFTNMMCAVLMLSAWYSMYRYGPPDEVYFDILKVKARPQDRAVRSEPPAQQKD